MFDGKAFGREIVEAVKGHIDRTVAPISARIEALERRFDDLPPARDGKDADISEMRQIAQNEMAGLKTLIEAIPPAPVLPDISEMVEEALAARVPADMAEAIQEAARAAVAELPMPQDGKSISVEDIIPAIDAIIAEKISAIPAAKDGVSVSIDDVRPVIEAEVAKRVSELPVPKDGEPGKDADPEVIRAMVEDAVSALPPAKDGKSVTIDDMLPIMNEALQKAISAIDPPKDGRGIADLAINQNGDLIVNFSDGTEKNAGRALGWDGADIDWDCVHENLAKMFDAWPKPKDGKDGKLPIVKVWEDAVHYAGDVVTFDGRLYQAQRDTGKMPDSADWLCLAERGRDGEDGRSFVIRGTWSESEDYRELDVVALNGGSFVAKRDNPGICPGEGWQLMASQGKRGQPGDRGIGIKGERGEAGLPVIAAHVSDDGLLTLVNGDGSQVDVDLYPLLSKLK